MHDPDDKVEPQREGLPPELDQGSPFPQLSPEDQALVDAADAAPDEGMRQASGAGASSEGQVFLEDPGKAAAIIEDLSRALDSLSG